MVLSQEGSTVEGTIYASGGSIYDTVAGEIYWGKGWMLDGEGQSKLGSFEWMMTSDERSFMGIAGSGNHKLYGTRESPVMVMGQVVDSENSPISGIGIAVTQDQTRSDAHSGDSGFFFVSLPDDSTGMWTVSVVSIDCTSRIMNAECSLNGYFDLYTTQTISIPQTEKIVFVYEIATSALIGTVVDQAGQPVSDARVEAKRSDGARSWVAASEGHFSLAVSPGTWEVYAMTFDPSQTGESVTVTIDPDVAPDPLTLIIP
jgi:hypothetical protein